MGNTKIQPGALCVLCLSFVALVVKILAFSSWSLAFGHQLYSNKFVLLPPQVYFCRQHQ